MASRSPTAATPVTVPGSRPTPHSSPASLPTFSGVDTHTPVSSNWGLVISSASASPPTLPVPTCATRIAMGVSVRKTLETFLDTSPLFFGASGGSVGVIVSAYGTARGCLVQLWRRPGERVALPTLVERHRSAGGDGARPRRRARHAAGRLRGKVQCGRLRLPGVRLSQLRRQRGRAPPTARRQNAA